MARRRVVYACLSGQVLVNFSIRCGRHTLVTPALQPYNCSATPTRGVPSLSHLSLQCRAPRYSLAPLTSVFAAMELGYTDAQKAYLLGAFFPGYIASQFPAGILSQLIGGKVMLTANLVGHALFMLLLPSAAALGYRWLGACLCCIGLVQGPMGPAQQKIKTAWLPVGPDRALALQIIALGSKAAGPLSNLAVPFLSSTFGWSAPRPRLLLPACPSLKG